MTSDALPVGLFWQWCHDLNKTYGHVNAELIVSLAASAGWDPRRVKSWLTQLKEGQILGPFAYANSSGPCRILRKGEALPYDTASKGQKDRAQALWTALRSLKGANAKTLAQMASTETLQITQAEAARFIKNMMLIGYVLRQDAPLGQQSIRLRPDKNTGPMCPLIIPRDKIAFDVNRLRHLEVPAWQQSRRPS